MQSIEYYLSRGFSRPMAEYFAAGRRRIVSVEPDHDLTLLLTFDNGEQRRYDVQPLVQPGSVFSFLSDPAAFARVYLDEDHAVSWDIDPDVDSVVVWSNKVDLSPDVCYVDSIPVEGGAPRV